MGLVGRKREIKELRRIYQSSSSEFVALNGRRRIGKTFLVREFFDYTFTFELSGLANGNTKQQLLHFHQTFDQQSPEIFDGPPSNWLEAFARLRLHVSNSQLKRKVIFLDEMPWMDTGRSDFITALESFWNSFASGRKDVVLIATGSSSSWIKNKLINNTKGLHNRITSYIHLQAFTLRETESYLNEKGCLLSRYQITQLYMILGGIPYYLNYVTKGKSVPQIVDQLFFDKSAILRLEYKNLYKALFRNHEKHEQIVEALSSKTKGMTRSEIIKATQLPSGGSLSRTLEELEDNGFIASYLPIVKKSKDTLYRLTDYYSAFYLKWIAKGTYRGSGTWSSLIDHPKHRAWLGYTFEQVCIHHLDHLKKGLGISGMHSTAATWRNDKAQIDLLLDRRDDILQIFEMKFSINKYTVTLADNKSIRNKVAVLQNELSTNKRVNVALVTTFGITPGPHNDIISQSLTLEDLFASL
jgi:DNA-binding PadR family transcriptional regulator